MKGKYRQQCIVLLSRWDGIQVFPVVVHICDVILWCRRSSITHTDIPWHMQKRWVLQIEDYCQLQMVAAYGQHCLILVGSHCIRLMMSSWCRNRDVMRAKERLSSASAWSAVKLYLNLLHISSSLDIYNVNQFCEGFFRCKSFKLNWFILLPHRYSLPINNQRSFSKRGYSTGLMSIVTWLMQRDAWFIILC